MYKLTFNNFIQEVNKVFKPLGFKYNITDDFNIKDNDQLENFLNYAGTQTKEYTQYIVNSPNNDKNIEIFRKILSLQESLINHSIIGGNLINVQDEGQLLSLLDEINTIYTFCTFIPNGGYNFINIFSGLDTTLNQKDDKPSITICLQFWKNHIFNHLLDQTSNKRDNYIIPYEPEQIYNMMLFVVPKSSLKEYYLRVLQQVQSKYDVALQSNTLRNYRKQAEEIKSSFTPYLDQLINKRNIYLSLFNHFKDYGLIIEFTDFIRLFEGVPITLIFNKQVIHKNELSYAIIQLSEQNPKIQKDKLTFIFPNNKPQKFKDINTYRKRTAKFDKSHFVSKLDGILS